MRQWPCAEGTRLCKVSEAFQEEAGWQWVTSPVGWDLAGQTGRDKTSWESRVALLCGSSSADVQATVPWAPSQGLPLPCFDVNKQAPFRLTVLRSPLWDSALGASSFGHVPVSAPGTRPRRKVSASQKLPTTRIQCP